MAAPAGMPPRALITCLSALVLAALAVPRAWAGFVPLDNQSVAYSKSVAGAVVDDWTDQAAGLFDWPGLALSEADNGSAGWAAADFTVSTGSIDDSCMYAVGEGSGTGFGPGPYSHQGHGQARLLFIVNQTQEYSAILGINENDLPGTEHFIELTDRNMAVYWRHDAGSTNLLGRIAPGSYWLIGKTDYSQTIDGGRSWSFNAVVCMTTCVPLIGQQPLDQSPLQGATIDLQLTVNSPSPGTAHGTQGATAQAATTYQWRKNLQNLANGGRFSGVNTAHLVITGAAFADSGLYDCVVTQGTIVEPSRQAEVRVRSSVGVESPLAASELRLGVPRPNPFGASTRLDFELARAGRVSVVVYDALGRRVKELMPAASMSPGRYAVDWNGTDAVGNRVAGGVYFVHLLADGTRRLQRAVLMPGAK